MTKKTTVILRQPLFSWGFQAAGVLVFLYFFWLMLKITADYIPAGAQVGFLMIKQTEVNTHPAYLPVFYTHVYTGIMVLLSGFMAIVRPAFMPKGFHAFVGKMYVVLLLALCAPAGIYMGFLANGGGIAQTSFVLLGILWWVFTWRAFVFAKKKQFGKHRAWMWRSFVLTLSALTLRMWKVFFAYNTGLSPMEIYQIIAWLGWVPNIILIEILIHSKKL